jgi:hypothetical protein
MPFTLPYSLPATAAIWATDIESEIRSTTFQRRVTRRSYLPKAASCDRIEMAPRWTSELRRRDVSIAVPGYLDRLNDRPNGRVGEPQRVRCANVCSTGTRRTQCHDNRRLYWRLATAAAAAARTVARRPVERSLARYAPACSMCARSDRYTGNSLRGPYRTN